MTWDFIDRKIHKDFPNAQEIETDYFARIVANGSEYRLFDVREAKEFAVSHIEFAENLKTADAIAEAEPDKNAFIVTYCSVGYRSGKVASDLRTLGYAKVYNLKGSIFEWANSGKPVYLEGKETEFVHPFDEKWGTLLDKKLHRYDVSE